MSIGKQIVMTTTNELFLPTRIVYRVFDSKDLLRRFSKLRCVVYEEPNRRWTWNYEAEAKKMRFPAAYDQIPKEHRPLILASCYLVAEDTLHVYVRSTLRLQKVLVFFDHWIPRSTAQAEFMDEYNLVTAQEVSQPWPRPEDYFHNDAELEFFDADAFEPEDLDLKQLMERQVRKELAPKERHRLTAFYEDGEEHLVTAGRFREFLAAKQYQSAEPIRPFDVLQEAMQNAGWGAESSSSPAAPPAERKPQTPRPGTGQLKRFSLNNWVPFSCFRWDTTRNQLVFDLPPTGQEPHQYVAEFGCCDNPACSCEDLELWLTPFSEQGQPGDAMNFRLQLEKSRVRLDRGASRAAKRLAKQLEARLTSGDWQQAKNIYLAAKADVSEPEPPLITLPAPAARDTPKTGRNAPCPCGSGKKYKKCCGA